jgi:MFS family permease
MVLGNISRVDGASIDEGTSLLKDDDIEASGDPNSTIPSYGKFSNEDGEESEDSETSQDLLRASLSKEGITCGKKDELLPIWTIICILSSAFAYGCIMTTLFLVTLPIECERIEQQIPSIPKSVALGCFVAISGFTQLISPLAGMLSDTYRPPPQFQIGQRIPFLSLGSVLSVFGLLGEYVESYHKLWIPYAVFFFFHMIGLNVTYAMMIALIPDQVPHVQTGTANGILAFLLVTGSLAGFGFFHFYFNGIIQDMYGLYICIVVSIMERVD